jgi:hypothetical protein
MEVVVKKVETFGVSFWGKKQLCSGLSFVIP